MSISFEKFAQVEREKGLSMCGIAVNLHGEFVGEHRFKEDTPHALHSLSKSFAATAIGFAVDENLLTVEDAVLSFFPDIAPKDANEFSRAMTVKHLLTMTSGHSKPVMARMDSFAADADLAELFLSNQPDTAPGKRFVYDSGCTYMLSAILQKITGETMLDYLMPRLFAPLGIDRPVWEACPKGRTLGGTGLFLRTRELLPFGQLYLQRGLWEGRRLLSEGWIADASSYKIGTTQMEIYDKRMGYGYNFWMARHETYRGSGAFGQGCMILPRWDAVVAYTSDSGNLQGILDNVWDNIVPQLG